MKHIKLIICLYFIGISIGKAQQFRFKAALKAGKEDGFYKITLPPEIVNKTKADLGDIRLKDPKNNDVPYVLERTEAIKKHQYFQEYPIVKNSSIKGVKTTLIIRNKGRNKISNIGLLLKNTNVIKKASLSGSADTLTWYGLEDNIVLQNIASSLETSGIKILNFPLIDYEYYRLEINDSASAPLNILAAGYYDFRAESGDYTELANLNFSQTDSAESRQTYLKLSFPEPILIDKLVFEIDSTTFYRRSATIFEMRTITGKRGRKFKELVPVQTFLLESNSNNSWLLNGFRAANFYVVIENGDNPPLQLKQVRGYQLKTYLIAELKADKKYELVFGNIKTPRPNYDLEFFREKFPKNLPVVKPEKVEMIEDAVTSSKGINSLFRNKSIIWVAIIGVITLLAFMTRQMLRETGKRSG